MLTDANGESKKINFSTRGNRRLVRSSTPALQFSAFRDNPADSEPCYGNLGPPIDLPQRRANSKFPDLGNGHKLNRVLMQRWNLRKAISW